MSPKNGHPVDRSQILRGRKESSRNYLGMEIIQSRAYSILPNNLCAITATRGARWDTHREVSTVYRVFIWRWHWAGWGIHGPLIDLYSRSICGRYNVGPSIPDRQINSFKTKHLRWELSIRIWKLFLILVTLSGTTIRSSTSTNFRTSLILVRQYYSQIKMQERRRSDWIKEEKDLTKCKACLGSSCHTVVGDNQILLWRYYQQHRFGQLEYGWRWNRYRFCI